MDPRVLRRQSVSTALVVVALASCTHQPSPPVTLPAPAAASSEELRWAVEAALATRNWTVLERKPDAITAFVYSQGTTERAEVEIAYRPGVIDIRSVKQEVSRSRYDRWIKLLSSEIQKNVAQLGMKRPPAPPPSSEAPPPPSAVQ